VIEGAGSPAEINLRGGDLVNMSVAKECRADVYLVADIDRGGAFAHLLGTWTCLEPDERLLIKGFVLNKFRGDQTLLGNAMNWLQERTGVPTVAIIPMIPHTLPEEDTFRHRTEPVVGHINIALIVYPYASNLDEFDPLIYERGVTVVPVRTCAPLADFDAVILPGSKNTTKSLHHLRETGLADEIVCVARKGTPILGLCGGMQLLGRRVLDPHGVESGNETGLGLLDVTTTLNREKTTRQRRVYLHKGGELRGYEIHHGLTEAGPEAKAHLDDGLGWEQKNIRGVYLHGLFENTPYRQEFLGQLGWVGRAEEWREKIDSDFERMGRLIEHSEWFRVPRVGS
jgi:adenosylcobyric acid synthase